MSYTPTEWQTGDTITAEKLNNMESGIDKLNAYEIPMEIVSDGGGGYILQVSSGQEEDVYQTLATIAHSSRRIWMRFYVNGGTIGIFPVGIDIGASNISFYAEIPNDFIILFMPSFEGNATVVLSQSNYDVPWIPTITAKETGPFIVTLTPTAQDFSGTMDKTPAEITEAYNSGRRIRGVIAGMSVSFDFTQYSENTVNGENVISAYGTVVVDMSLLGGSGDALCSIGTNNDSSLYGISFFTLTPMS